MTKPARLNERPCSGCGAGYGECLQGAIMDLMCCRICNHPVSVAVQPCDRCCEFDAVTSVRCWYGCWHNQCERCAEQTRSKAREGDD